MALAFVAATSAHIWYEPSERLHESSCFALSSPALSSYGVAEVESLLDCRQHCEDSSSCRALSYSVTKRSHEGPLGTLCELYSVAHAHDATSAATTAPGVQWSDVICQSKIRMPGWEPISSLPTDDTPSPPRSFDPPPSSTPPPSSVPPTPPPPWRRRIAPLVFFETFFPQMDALGSAKWVGVLIEGVIICVALFSLCCLVLEVCKLRHGYPPPLEKTGPLFFRPQKSSSKSGCLSDSSIDTDAFTVPKHCTSICIGHMPPVREGPDTPRRTPSTPFVYMQRGLLPGHELP